jgi:hypothetical protein
MRPAIEAALSRAVRELQKHYAGAICGVVAETYGFMKEYDGNPDIP